MTHQMYHLIEQAVDHLVDGLFARYHRPKPGSYLIDPTCVVCGRPLRISSRGRWRHAPAASTWGAPDDRNELHCDCVPHQCRCKGAS